MKLGARPEELQGAFALLDAGATAVVAVDEKAVIRYVNARATQVFQYTAEELLGQAIEMLIPADHTEEHLALRQAYREQPVARPPYSRHGLRGRRKDGEEFDADISLTPVPSSSGTWVFASVLDISLQREAQDRIRQQSRAYLALALLNEAVAAAIDQSTLFNRVCNLSVVHGGYTGAWVLTRGTGDTLRLVASAGPLATRLAVTRSNGESVEEVDVEQGVAFHASETSGPARVFVTGQPIFTDDHAAASADPRSRARAARFEVRSSAALPLVSQGLTVAVLCLYSDQPDSFPPTVRHLLLNLAANVSQALDRFEARRQLDATLAQREELLRRLVNAQEDERSRIAADVHDDSVQAVAAIDLQLGLLERRLAEVAPDLLPSLELISGMLQSVNDGLRELLFHLEPVHPEATMPDLAEEAASHILADTSVRWTVRRSQSGPSAAPDATAARSPRGSITTRTQALRILNEALVNVRKHAHASSVIVEVSEDDLEMTITVTDDGHGIDPAITSSPPGHRGITGMRDRATIAGGSLEIGRAGPGTVVRFTLPQQLPE